MPHETRQQAEARAEREGFPMSAVVKSDDDGWFIAPHGVTTAEGKTAYANCRASGKSKKVCAMTAHLVDGIVKGKRND